MLQHPIKLLYQAKMCKTNKQTIFGSFKHHFKTRHEIGPWSAVICILVGSISYKKLFHFSSEVIEDDLAYRQLPPYLQRVKSEKFESFYNLFQLKTFP